MDAVVWGGVWHPLAERFPTLTEDELLEMAESIREHGQFVPCRMTASGLGLDGRNRVAACAIAGVEPTWEVYDGEDAVAFIVEVNSERRHLSTGQRAMATAIGLAESGLRANGRFRRGSVPDNGSSSISAWQKAVTQAGFVLDHAPDLADPVLRGEVALDAAYAEAVERRDRMDRLLGLQSDLRALVDAHALTLDEAEERVREAAAEAEREERIAALPADLAARVRDGGLSVTEADAILVERAARVRALAERVREALTTIGRMAGVPIPPELLAELTDDEGETLRVVLSALDKRGTT